MALADHESALILSGGGARAAYQVGALRAIAKLVRRRARVPFPVICGTSAGAINAAVLATHADDLRRGVARLLRWWRRIHVEDVYRADLATLARHGARWMASIVTGTRAPARAASMLDNAPLARMLSAELDLSRLDRLIKTGGLRALAINATSYATGHAVTFYQGALSLAPWQRTRRRGQPCVFAIEHLMASTAIPFIFPAVRVGVDYYMDGSVRQIAPLSAALHLGARRLMVLAVGQFAGQRAIPGETVPRYPSFAQTAGHALSSVFLDHLGADLERLTQMNRLLDLVPPLDLARLGRKGVHVDAFVLTPSQDLGELALEHAHRLPRGVRTLLRGLGSTQGSGANLVSYLLFDRHYTRALLALGHSDALARAEEIDQFLCGATVNYLPFPPGSLL